MAITHDVPPAAGSGPPSCSERLVRQVQQLAEITEALTYRSLELEERLAMLEQQLQALAGECFQSQSQLQPTEPQRIDRALQQTEARLGRIGSALGSRGGPAGGEACRPDPRRDAATDQEPAVLSITAAM